LLLIASDTLALGCIKAHSWFIESNVGVSILKGLHGFNDPLSVPILRGA